MRSIWRGAISFGMVSIPVKLYSATEQKDVRFRLLHKADGAPIKEKRVCTADGQEVEWKDLVRGFDVGTGEYVVLDPEEIDAAQPESATTIEIGDFVQLTEIDPIYFEKSYFLEPTDVVAKPFTLLRRALEETKRTAVARVVIRSKERLATIRPYDDTLMLETMFWPDEIRSTGSLDMPEGDEARVHGKELEMARSLVENLSDRFKPEEYRDVYRVALEQLIARKLKGQQRSVKRRKPEPRVTDPMEALKQSVEASRSSRPAAAKPRRNKARTRKSRAA